jgi:hypothetical protein
MVRVQAFKVDANQTLKSRQSQLVTGGGVQETPHEITLFYPTEQVAPAIGNMWIPQAIKPVLQK